VRTEKKGKTITASARFDSGSGRGGRERKTQQWWEKKKKEKKMWRRTSEKKGKSLGSHDAREGTPRIPMGGELGRGGEKKKIFLESHNCQKKKRKKAGDEPVQGKNRRLRGPIKGGERKGGRSDSLKSMYDQKRPALSRGKDNSTKRGGRGGSKTLGLSGIHFNATRK